MEQIPALVYFLKGEALVALTLDNSVCPVSL